MVGRRGKPDLIIIIQGDVHSSFEVVCIFLATISAKSRSIRPTVLSLVFLFRMSNLWSGRWRYHFRGPMEDLWFDSYIMPAAL